MQKKLADFEYDDGIILKIDKSGTLDMVWEFTEAGMIAGSIFVSETSIIVSFHSIDAESNGTHGYRSFQAKLSASTGLEDWVAKTQEGQTLSGDERAENTILNYFEAENKLFLCTNGKDKDEINLSIGKPENSDFNFKTSMLYKMTNS